METLRVNRFKTYRTFRWCRSNYLWQPKNNPYLKEYGIRVQDDSNEPADVLAIPCPHLPGKEDFAHVDDGLTITIGHRGEFDYADLPVICDSSLDYAFLDPTVRSLLSYPQVKAYLPNVTFRDPVAQQRQTWGGEYYGVVVRNHMLYRKGTEVRQERDVMPAHIKQKIKPIVRPPTAPFSDDVFRYIEQNIKPLKERSLDLFFSGRDTYHPIRSGNFPTYHRQRLTKELWPDLPGSKFLLTYDNTSGTKRRGKIIKSFSYPYEYVDMLLASKVIVSPWGWGAWCIRDIEALACGCIVIKPECTNTLVYPDIYDPTKQFLVWTDVAFEYLADQLNYCYEHLDELQERVNRGRKFVVNALYPNAKVYKRWTADLRTYLEESLSQSYATAAQIPEFNVVFS